MNVRFEIVTAMTIKITVFRNVTLCSLADHYTLFGVTSYLHLLGRRTICRRHIPEDGNLHIREGWKERLYEVSSSPSGSITQWGWDTFVSHLLPPVSYFLRLICIRISPCRMFHSILPSWDDTRLRRPVLTDSVVNYCKIKLQAYLNVWSSLHSRNAEVTWFTIYRILYS